MSDLRDDEIPIPAGMRERNLERVQAGIRRRTARTRAVVVGAVALVAGGALTAAAAVTLVPKPVEQRSVWCFDGASIDAQHESVQIDTADPVGDRTANALDNCRLLWSNGALHADGVASGDVPQLAACVNGDGLVWVFPRDAGDARGDATFCRALGVGRAPRG